jgi:UDP-3-O-[3-hydroxymyristoyl] glucosamine N-acyltransferase
MDTISFFPPHEGMSLSDIADRCGADLADPSLAERQVTGVAPLSRAGADEITFANSRKALPDLKKSGSRCVCERRQQCSCARGSRGLITNAPQTAFAIAASALVPGSMRPDGACWCPAPSAAEPTLILPLGSNQA